MQLTGHEPLNSAPKTAPVAESRSSGDDHGSLTTKAPLDTRDQVAASPRQTAQRAHIRALIPDSLGSRDAGPGLTARASSGVMQGKFTHQGKERSIPNTDVIGIFRGQSGFEDVLAEFQRILHSSTELVDYVQWIQAQAKKLGREVPNEDSLHLGPEPAESSLESVSSKSLHLEQDSAVTGPLPRVKATKPSVALGGRSKPPPIGTGAPASSKLTNAEQVKMRREALRANEERELRDKLKRKEERTQAATAAREQNLKAKSDMARLSSTHGSVGATEADRFPLASLIGSDAALKDADVAMIGLGSSAQGLPPQVEEVATALKGKQVASLTLFDINPQIIGQVQKFSKQLSELTGVDPQAIEGDIVSLAKEVGQEKAYDRIVSTMTLMYPLSDYLKEKDGRTKEQGKAFAQHIQGMLKPGGRLWTDSKYSAKKLMEVWPDWKGQDLEGEHEGLTEFVRPLDPPK